MKQKSLVHRSGSWRRLLARVIRVWRRKQRHDSPFNPSPTPVVQLVFPRVRLFFLAKLQPSWRAEGNCDRRERDVTDGFVGVVRVFCSLKKRRVYRPSKEAHNLSDWLPPLRQIYYEVTTKHAPPPPPASSSPSSSSSSTSQNDVGDTDATMDDGKTVGRSMDPSNGFRGWDYLWARLTSAESRDSFWDRALNSRYARSFFFGSWWERRRTEAASFD